MGRATASAVTAEAADPDRGHRVLAPAGDLVRRYWGTTFVVACVLVAGLVTGAL